MGLIVKNHHPSGAKKLIKHPQGRLLCHPGSWELDHSNADIDLLAKAAYRNGELSGSERERIVSITEPTIGKALANPSSLTEEERRFVMGWPSPEQYKANIAAVGLGNMTPEEILAKTAADPWWLKTLDQATLIKNRFNIRPTLPKLQKWEFTFDQQKADILVQRPSEKTAYSNAEEEEKLLTRPARVWEGARGRVLELEQQVEAERAYERKWEKGPFCPISTLEWIRQLGRQGGTFGFIIYKTPDLRVIFDEFIRAHPTYPNVGWAESFDKVWEYFLRYRIFGKGGEINYMHFLTRATLDSYHEQDYMKWSTGDLEAPADDVSAYKAHYWSARIQEPELHQRYFLVMEKDGFPRMKNIVFEYKPVFPEVWVYDADWEPPADGDGVHDADGYRGRLRMRYAYHAYLYFYPLTLEEGFDLKNLWVEQEDESKPYPFPLTELGYDDYVTPNNLIIQETITMGPVEQIKAMVDRHNRGEPPESPK